MNNAFKNINEIPVTTWSWLNVNSTDLKQDFPPVTAYRKDPQAGAIPAGVDLSPIAQLSDYPGEHVPEPKAKEALLTYMRENRNSGYFIRIAEGETVEEPIFLSYELDEQSPVLLDDTFILAEKGSRATVVICYASAGTDTAFHSGMTRIHAQDGSELRLIKVQMLSDKDSHVDRVAAAADVRSKVEVLLAELGSKQSVTNCNIDLRGENSKAQIDSVYLGDKERTLDINYHVAHLVKNTVSDIHSRGVLADRSEKVFRGTIDFARGASGSKGKEEEYTVLFSPHIKNISTPLLLCGEEDVEGAHAASSGKLDETKLFYLMTRGLSEADAKKMIVEASFGPILKKITEEALRERVLSYIRERLSHV